MSRTLGILISGRGSNLQALLDAVQNGNLDARVGVVISNCADALGLVIAKDASIPTVVLDHKNYADRELFDGAILKVLLNYHVDVVCLAGFMRILSPVIVGAFPERILNVHPSLLPSFVGLHAQRQAVEHGAKVSGCTIHFVDRELDHGPILMQCAVPVKDGDTEEILSQRILKEEHRLYPKAVQLVLDGKVQVEGRRTVITK